VIVQDFEALYAASYPRLRRVLAAVTLDVADADDALQEAFTRAAARWRKVGDLDDPEAWVRRVALNQAMDQHRRRARDRRQVTTEGMHELDPQLLDLKAALQELPFPQRQALVLHHLLDLSVADTARELGRPEGTVKAQLMRGREALGKVLDPTREAGS
jgi:RNA polymerase sigma-70 factor (ECF subfamily)